MAPRRQPYVPSKHVRVVRVTLRFDTRNPLHHAIAAYLTRSGVVESVSTRARKLMETGFEARRARNALERTLSASSDAEGRDEPIEID